MRHCPNECGYLTELNYEDAIIDFCNKCRGVWLDYGELSHIVKKRERQWAEKTVDAVLQKLSSYNQPPLGEDRVLACPECQIELDEVIYQGISNIVVNPCLALHGVWLDRGELVQIQIYMEHWQDAAKEDEAEIEEALAVMRTRYEAFRENIILQGPASSTIVNEMIFETLEFLEKRG